jgi:hypothetical protein
MSTYPEDGHRATIAAASTRDTVRAPNSHAEKLATVGVAALTAGWFLASWLMRGKPFVDAAGETVGVVSAILLGVATLGTLRRPSRSPHQSPR